MKYGKWYCYCCGLFVNKEYYLCSNIESTDRVYIYCARCINKNKVDEDIFIVKVIEER